MLFDYDDPDREAKLKGFILLGDSVALKILFVLDRHGDKNFSELKDILGVNPASLSKKLKMLTEAGVLRSDHTHDRLRVYYSIAQNRRLVKKFIDSFEKLAQNL